MAGSGFAITFPDDWSVEVADPDPDVLSAEPGTAWEALRATAHDRSMACSVAVGTAELLPGQWFGTGQDGVTKPYWDPKEPWRLWVPTPAIPRTTSFHQTDWSRHPQEDPDLEHDVLYSLMCAADNASVEKPSRIFELIMPSFEFLPAEE
jgi:hypothetical protein